MISELFGLLELEQLGLAFLPLTYPAQCRVWVDSDRNMTCDSIMSGTRLRCPLKDMNFETSDRSAGGSIYMEACRVDQRRVRTASG